MDRGKTESIVPCLSDHCVEETFGISGYWIASIRVLSPSHQSHGSLIIGGQERDSMERLELDQQQSFSPETRRPGVARWTIVAILALTLWLGGSLALDCLVMPSLYWAGMMTDAAFMDAGSVLFGAFNRVELVLAGITLAGLLAAGYLREMSPRLQRWTVGLGLVLLGVAVVDTYGVTPSMVSLGANLEWPTTLPTVPTEMTQLHSLYFGLEMVKVLAAAAVLGLWVSDRRQSDSPPVTH